MIEALKDDQIFHKVGGKFKFTALAQRRMKELMEGARPLVERRGRTDFEVAVQEIAEGKIVVELDGQANLPEHPGAADPVHEVDQQD